MNRKLARVFVPCLRVGDVLLDDSGRWPVARAA